MKKAELKPALNGPRRAVLDAIERRGTSMAAVSHAIGKSHAYIQQWIERGVPHDLKEDVRHALAQHLELDEDQLRATTRNLSTSSTKFITPQNTAPHGSVRTPIAHPDPVVMTARVRGELRAGAWMEAEAWDEARYAPVPYPSDRYEALPHSAWRVVGNSMDLRGLIDGGFAITVPYARVRVAPLKGDPVVVERRRAGTIERTCKEIGTVTDTTLELVPRSSDPREQPILIPLQGLDEDGAEVEVIGLIVWSVAGMGAI